MRHRKNVQRRALEKYSQGSRTASVMRVLPVLWIVLPHVLVAATLTVDGQTGDPPGTCDLVEAIENANSDLDTNTDCTGVGPYGADTIELTEDVVLDTASVIDLGLGPYALLVETEIEIQGNGYAIRRSAAALDDFRIFLVTAAGDLTLQDTAVSGGAGVSGGAILNENGIATLINSTLSGNSATSGGAIYNDGTLQLIDSTLMGNTAFGNGGAIRNLDTLVVTRSTLSGNDSTANGGAFSNEFGGTATVTDSTLSGNSAGGGYAIVVLDSTLELVNTTLAGNTGAGSGALWLFTGTATETARPRFRCLSRTPAPTSPTTPAAAPGSTCWPLPTSTRSWPTTAARR